MRFPKPSSSPPLSLISLSGQDKGEYNHLLPDPTRSGAEPGVPSRSQVLLFKPCPAIQLCKPLICSRGLNVLRQYPCDSRLLALRRCIHTDIQWSSINSKTRPPNFTLTRLYSHYLIWLSRCSFGSLKVCLSDSASSWISRRSNAAHGPRWGLS